MNAAFLKLIITAAYSSKLYEQTLTPGERLMQQGDLGAGTLGKVARSYFHLKKYEDCVRVCDYLDSNKAADENIYYYEATAKTKLKDYEGSNELLQKCVSLAISSTAEQYYYSLAENFYALKQFKKSIANYDTAYYLFKNPLPLYNCGYIAETSLNNNDVAKKYYLKYLQLAKPNSPDQRKAYQYVKEKWAPKKKKAANK
jgi:tetratricopeptide (TPR) repeat protein